MFSLNGLKRKSKHDILQGKTKANKTKRPRKSEEFEERVFLGKKARKYLKLQVTVFRSTDSNTPFDIHSNSALFGRGAHVLECSKFTIFTSLCSVFLWVFILNPPPPRNTENGQNRE